MQRKDLNEQREQSLRQQDQKQHDQNQLSRAQRWSESAQNVVDPLKYVAGGIGFLTAKVVDLTTYIYHESVEHCCHSKNRKKRF